MAQERQEQDQRQYVRYAFYKVRPEWLARPPEQRERDKQVVAAVLERFAERMVVLRAYSTVGMRGDCDLMLWSVSWRLEDFTELATALSTSPLGPFLETPHSYLAMTKRSIYVKEHVHEGQEGARSRIIPMRCA